MTYIFDTSLSKLFGINWIKSSCNNFTFSLTTYDDKKGILQLYDSDYHYKICYLKTFSNCFLIPCILFSNEIQCLNLISLPTD